MLYDACDKKIAVQLISSKELDMYCNAFNKKVAAQLISSKELDYVNAMLLIRK